MNSSLPGKAAEIRALLLSLIDTLPEGAALPPERELSVRWNVARMTLRRAVDELVIEELLVRRHGSGTYTARPKVTKWLGMMGFSEDLRRRGMRPGSRMLEFRRTKAERPAARRLRIPVGDPVVTFTRLRLADETPMAVERTTLPGSYVPGLEAEDLNGSLYDLLTSRYGIELGSGTSKLEPVMPDAKTAGWLGIPGTQPCLALHGVSFDRRERVFEYTSAVFRGDRYAFTAELRTAPTVRANAKGI
ncbi:GntR family transcriptional regulator [Kribbella sp. CA-293567]|uniref:GntR family transcriptional regulator n=1 Tax=Kribbella sp. CA-293567 TaxID=3002436 RepID=UPI0022DE1892|nr:GntR family transcriptional regulator [Kribbella sp. CA-293567]WBQ05368.1 GntR family transcriptional regulator [Kribbella sp. CA-293567]